MSKTIKLLGSFLLLFAPVAQTQGVLAQQNQTGNKTSMEKQLRSNSNDYKSWATNEYYQAVKAQLSTRGVDVSKLNFSDLSCQSVKVIVELDDKPAVNQIDVNPGTTEAADQIDQAANNVIDGQTDIKDQVEEITGNKVKHAYGYLFNGFSITAKPNQIPKIKNLPGVKKVTVSHQYRPTDATANDLANVQKVWSNNHLKGEGMVISIIDTGIDSTHKDLRLTDPSKEKITSTKGNNMAKTLGYGKACSDKIPFAYNYADGTSETVWDTGTTMHGMHVAGIAAANGNDGNASKDAQGIAPEAQLLNMKVFSNSSNTASDDDIISAIEDSVKLGADVINLSLGSTAGDVDSKDPEQIALANAAKQGVIPVVAAGNEGMSNSANGTDVPFYQADDSDTVNAPGVSADAITVASSENSSQMKNTAKIVDSSGKDVLGKEISGQLSTVASFASVSGHGFYVAKNGKDGLPGIGNPEDFDDNAKDKIAIVTRGTTTFLEKQENAKAWGAVGIVIIDNNPNDSQLNFSWDETFPSLGVTTNDGKALVKAVNAAPQATYTISIGKQKVASLNGGKMSSFTSWGPTNDLSFKPDITAPGGQILSLANKNSYKTMSGTSMATPFIAGATAILAESLKKEGLNLSKDQLTKFAKTSLMNTAKPMLDVSSQGNLVSPRQQGSGLIQLDKAVDNRVSATTPTGDSSFALKEIGQNVDMTVTLTNRGDREVKYTFNDHGGPWTSNDQLNRKVNEMRISKASLTTDSNTVVVPAHGTKNVVVHLTLPMDFPNQKFVEGYIGFDSESSPNLVIPYLGFHGKWGQSPIIDQPSWSQDSIFGGGYFKDSDGNILGSNLPRSIRKEQNSAPDFSSDPSRILKHIKPETVAISPNNDGNQDYAYPTYYLLKNGRNPSFEIVDSNNKVIKIIDQETNIRKSFYDAKSGAFTTSTHEGLAWDGKVWDEKQGKNVKVADGNYKYRLTVNPTTPNSLIQTQDLPIKVDTVEPKLTNIQLQRDSNGLYLSVDLSDSNSGIQNMGVMNTTINGVPQNYNLYDDSGKKVSLNPLKVRLVPEQVASLTSGKNQIEVGVLDNAGNYGYTKKLMPVPGLSAQGLVTYNLQNGQRISTATPYVDAKNSMMTINGWYNRDIYINGKLGKIDPNNIFSVKVPIPSDGIFRFSTDPNGKNIIRTVKTVIAMKTRPIYINDSGKTVNTDKSSYEVKGTVDPGITKVTIKGGKKDVIINANDLFFDRSFVRKLDLHYGVNKLTITTTDIDGNVSEPVTITVNSSYDDDPSDQVTFNDEDLEKVGDTKVITTKTKGFNTENGMYTISGKLKRPVGALKIAGEAVKYDPKNLTFKKTIQLPTNGYKSIWVYVVDKNGKTLVDGSIRFKVDTNLPTISFNDSKNWRQDEQGNYQVTTLRNPYVISGTANDNYSGFKVFANNSVVSVTPAFGLYNQSTGFPVNFSVSANLKPGLNRYQISVIDSSGNIVSHNLNITYQGLK
ncbi:S8 family serine peptidase [Xylocopilactobacillus apicola]|uniref:Peptidase S8 n=1 Tax=Xylocopilactobacillus apicola TaxID=2932184 RepID=A0AAU9DA91_9LACO|nr:S8 family serine peptidase [Xylocopilactobacillus apicola]BDR59300.1 peptidase S8 [Xylocopilactobacillus apicola]